MDENRPGEFQHNRKDLLIIMLATVVVLTGFLSIKFFFAKSFFLSSISHNIISKYIK